MNKLFLNHLADILDGLPPYQLSLEANQYDAQHQDANTDTGIDAEPVLHRLDRFFMTGDIRNNDFEPSWIDWNGTVCGNLEAWAALTAAREQDIPLPLTQEAVAQICRRSLVSPRSAHRNRPSYKPVAPSQPSLSSRTLRCHHAAARRCRAQSLRQRRKPG